MNKGIIAALFGVGGFAAGFGLGWYVIKAKYDAKVMAEIEKDMKNTPSQESKEEKTAVDIALTEGAQAPLPSNSIEYNRFYKGKPENYTIDDVEAIFAKPKEEEKEEESDEEEEEYEEDDTYPEFIEEEEMSKFPFTDVEELIYFEKDCYLTDLHYNEIDDIGDTIGNACYLQLNNIAKRCTSGAVYWVVNEKNQTFYKIHIKLKAFASVKTSLEAEDED